MDEENGDTSILLSDALLEEPCEVSKVPRHDDLAFGLGDGEDLVVSSASQADAVDRDGIVSEVP